jgi:hypothetical protein
MFNGKCWTIRTSDASRIRDLQALRDGPAFALLRVAARNPRAVAEALHRESRKGAA